MCFVCVLLAASHAGTNPVHTQQDAVVLYRLQPQFTAFASLPLKVWFYCLQARSLAQGACFVIHPCQLHSPPAHTQHTLQNAVVLYRLQPQFTACTSLQLKASELIWQQEPGCTWHRVSDAAEAVNLDLQALRQALGSLSGLCICKRRHQGPKSCTACQADRLIGLASAW